MAVSRHPERYRGVQARNSRCEQRTGKGMAMDREQFDQVCDCIRHTRATGETETPLGRALKKWQHIDIPVQRDGRWLLEGFIMSFRRDREILHAFDPSISPDLPAHLLDLAMIADFFGIPVEEFGCTGGFGQQRRPTEEEHVQESGGAAALRILVSFQDKKEYIFASPPITVEEAMRSVSFCVPSDALIFRNGRPIKNRKRRLRDSDWVELRPRPEPTALAHPAPISKGRPGTRQARERESRHGFSSDFHRSSS